MGRSWLTRSLPVLMIGSIGIFVMDWVETPTATLAHTVVSPRLIRLEVEAHPDQLVEAKWTLECERSDGTMRRTRTSVTRTTPLTQDVPLPVRRPERCDIRASAAFVDGDGHLEVVLLKQ